MIAQGLSSPTDHAERHPIHRLDRRICLAALWPRQIGDSASVAPRCIGAALIFISSRSRRLANARGQWSARTGSAVRRRPRPGDRAGHVIPFLPLAPRSRRTHGHENLAVIREPMPQPGHAIHLRVGASGPSALLGTVSEVEPRSLPGRTPFGPAHVARQGSYSEPNGRARKGADLQTRSALRLLHLG
jgi:hypothetical protein